MVSTISQGGLRSMYDIVCRETREAEVKELCAQGKLPHEVELEKHPEKSLEGRMCEYFSHELRGRLYCLVGSHKGLWGELRALSAYVSKSTTSF